MARIRIKKLGGLTKGYNQIAPSYMPNAMAEKQMEVRDTLQPVDKKFANIEAEKGETLLDLNVDGLPAHYKIGGKKHSKGGTPLATNDHSFIFSADPSLKIKDPYLLAEFGKLSKDGKAKNGGELPADIAKTYDLNKYRKILADPNSDKMEKDTAEQMIKNYNLKLSKLALVQESMKGFPDGIPDAGLAYIAMAGIDPQQLLPIDVSKGSVKSNPSIYNTKTKMPEGGTPPSGTKVSGTNTGGPGDKDVTVEPKKQDETDADYQNRLYQAQQDATSKGGKVYIKNGDKYQVLTGNVRQTTNFTDTRLGKHEKSYGYLQSTIDNNPDLRKAIYEGYQKHIADPNNRLSKTERDKLSKLDEDAVIKNFMEGQKQVYAIHASGMNLPGEEKEWNNQQYADNIKKLGFDNPMNTDEIAMFQASYKGLQDASQDPNLQPVLKDFNLAPVGKNDQTYNGKPISPVDKIFGNTTAGQAVLPENVGNYGFEDVQQQAQDLIPETLNIPKVQNPNHPFWLQDTTEIAGRAGDFASIKKYLPWAPKLFPKTMDPTFYDPTRELGQQKEDAAMAYEATKAFGQGPQALGSRSAAIQGAEAKAAADTLSKYNNLNVGVDNQTKQINLGIINQYGMANAQLATDLYDKTTIANQQYDNAKREASTALREAFKTGLTNRAKAQALNTMYPDYQVDPSTGGLVNFTPDPNKKLKPGSGYSNPNLDAYSAALKDPQYSHISKEDLASFFGVKSNLQNNNDSFDPQEQYMNAYNVVTPDNYPGPYGQ